MIKHQWENRVANKNAEPGYLGYGSSLARGSA